MDKLITFLNKEWREAFANLDTKRVEELNEIMDELNLFLTKLNKN